MKKNFNKIRSSAPDARTPVRTNTTSPAPAPAPQSSGGGMMSGLIGTMTQGLAFGTGSAVAHRAVGAVSNSFGGEGEAAPVQASADQRSVPAFAGGAGGDACSVDKANFFDCLKATEGDVHSCQFLADAMKACQSQQLNGVSKW